MTNTITALQALTDACDILETTKVCSQVSEVFSSVDKALKLCNSAIAALAAPAPALDAPAALVEDCTVYVLNSRGTNRWWATVQGGHDDKGHRIDDDECRQIAQVLAARASQPTPAQDAAATVLVPPAGAGASSQVIPISELHQHAAGAAAIVEKLYNETPDVSTAVQAGAWMQRAAQYLSATPTAPQVSPTAAQPVPELRERLGMAHDASLDDEHRECRAILMEIIRLLDAAPTTPQAPALVPLTDHHKLDNDQQVFFYEQDFYVLSNFSSFSLEWQGLTFPTSEHAYHWEKFASEELGLPGGRSDIAHLILTAPSAHEAFKIAERMKAQRRADWDAVKVGIMRDILRAKAQQHEYVRRKLLATGERELIEDSWRDSYWGWGPNRNGQNMLGKLWMEVRAELRGITPAGTTPKEQQ